MTVARRNIFETVVPDFAAGTVVFFVALPLCLGVALASNAPLSAGLLAGVIGGIVVGLLSRSQTSVSGPAAGLTTVVATQIQALGSFDAFLLAVVVAGALQVLASLLRAGSIAAFVPSCVIKGLLAAIGVILILKQIPHLLGHDTDPEGDMAFRQPDHENTFSEFGELIGDIHPGAAIIGLLSLLLLIFHEKLTWLKRLKVPAPLLVVATGVGLAKLFQWIGDPLAISANHLVDVPVTRSFQELGTLLHYPDFSQWSKPAIYLTGLTIAIVASLETLLNLEAVDKLDPQRRVSPPSRELAAQGIGNMVAGLLGGIPVTSVIIRSSVNINAGGQTKLSTVIHGLLLLVCVVLLPSLLNSIPLSCLAAILLMTGIKLANPDLVRQLWSQGRSQFLPFLVTVMAIVLTDLLIGILIGLVVSISFIVWSNIRRPLRQSIEKHLSGDVWHIELANQVSFLNRAALERTLNQIPHGGQVLLDARTTVYIDADVLSLIRDFREKTAIVRRIQVSLLGFRPRYHIADQIRYQDHSSREIQQNLTPGQVLQILKDGNERFRNHQHLTRDLGRQMRETALGQYPLAVVLGCIDSRTSPELIFDLGLGDIFNIRIAGNIVSPRVLGSMEFGCAIAGAKLIVVKGHTKCGAVGAAVNLAASGQTALEANGCRHLDAIVEDIQESVTPSDLVQLSTLPASEVQKRIDAIARQNVLRVMQKIMSESDTLRSLVDTNRIAIVGSMYDVTSGAIEFFSADGTDLFPDAPQPKSQTI